MGDTHLEIAASRLHRKFAVEVNLEVPRVPYKETITVPVEAEYKHKKQTGGHGQYGHVVIKMEPLAPGGGFEFAEKVVGGSVPKNYIPAVDKGIKEARLEGMNDGSPVLLEPIMTMTITVPDSFTGDIIGDLNTKRARVLGMNPNQGINVIQALAPQSEVLRYAIDLRSMTQGRGTFTIHFDHYEPVPALQTQKIIAAHKATAKQE
jgi:elongation factor G